MAGPKTTGEFWLPTVPEPPQPRDPNRWMQPVTLAVSTSALTMMIVGFVWLVTLRGHELMLPGASIPPLGEWFRDGLAGPTVWIGLGAALLGLLPALRVLLALAFYLREGVWKDALAAIAVLLILIASMFIL
jgi:hypothetical protein